MSEDGADLGVKPERALGMVLGGKEQPADGEKMTREQMLVEIMKAPDDYTEAATTYDGTTMWLAKQFYLLRRDGVDGDAFSLYEAMEKKCGKQDYDFTGFMVGYANNVVRWVMQMPPAANPAIVTIGGD